MTTTTPVTIGPKSSPVFDQAKPIALHFGLKEDRLRRLTPDMPWAYDGDGFAAWGEAPGTDVNDLTTLHVVLYVETLQEGLRHIADTFGDADLVPMGHSTRAPGIVTPGLKAIVVATSAQDWSEQDLGSWDSVTDFDLDIIEPDVDLDW